MSTVEYYHVFESILYGLALAQIFAGIGKMINHRREISFYWAYTLLIVLGTILIIRQFYTGMNSITFELVNSPIAFYLIVALNPCSWVLLTFLIFPDNFKGADFREVYQDKRKALFTLVFIQQSSQLIENIVDARLLGYYVDWPSFLEFASSPFFIFYVVVLTMFLIMDLALLSSKSFRLFETFVSLLFVFALILMFEI